MPLLTLIFTAMLGGLPAQAAKQASYGIVDMQKVILNVQEGIAAKKKLEKHIKAKEREFATSKKELEQMNSNWQKQASVLSQKAKLEKQREFQEKLIKLRNAELAFQAEIKSKEQEATSRIANKIGKIVEKLAIKKKLAAVFEISSSGIVYVRDPVDLTQEVISMYDKTKIKKKK